MVPTLPQGLEPLFSLRPLRDFAANLPNSIPKPNLVNNEFARSKETVVSPQQAESNQTEVRSEDLGQSEPVPFGLKPLNKLSETDVSRIRDSVSPTLPKDNPIEVERLALRKQVLRPENIDQFAKPESRAFLSEETNEILRQGDNQQRRVITTANALQATVIPPSAQELQPVIDESVSSPSAERVNQLALESARLQSEPIEKRALPALPPVQSEPKAKEPPPPEENNKQPQGGEPAVQANLPNPTLQERVRSAYGLPPLNQTTVPKTQDLFDRLSTVSVQG